MPRRLNPGRSIHMAKPKSLPYEAGETPEAYSVTLHNTSGGSDKIYMLSVSPAADGLWTVEYANGRRGSTMATGTKTKSPVPYAEARKACNSQLFDKVAGGYVPIGGSRFGEGMKAEAIATMARESSGFIPQLLLPVEQDDLEALIADDAYCAQRKYDGERRFLIVEDRAATGGNRKGQTVALPAAIATAARTIGDSVVLDGEQVGDNYYCWDILRRNGKDLTSLPMEERQFILARQVMPQRGPSIHVAETMYGAEDKRWLLERVKAEGGEGVVFKRRDAAYEPGKPGSKASWRKFKFWNSLSAVVGQVNDRRSVGLELFDGEGGRIAVGNVTIPANREIPAEGDVVEVSYLYAYDGGSLFQPTYLGKRSDIDPAECLAAQRVFKPENEETSVFGM